MVTAFIYISLAAIGVTPTVAGNNLAVFAVYLTAMLAVVAVLRLWIGFKQLNLRQFGLKAIKPVQWLKFLPLSVIVYFGLSAIFTALAIAFWPQFDPQEVQELGFEPTRSLVQMMLIFAALGLVAPVVEELVFRGVVFKGLRSAMPFWLAAGLSSLFFGLAHFQANVAVDTAAMGITACWLVERTGSLWPAIALHVAKNSLAFVYVFVIGV